MNPDTALSNPIALNGGQRAILASGIESAQWHLGLGLVVVGGLDVGLFEEALRITLNRHPILRSKLNEDSFGDRNMTVLPMSSVTVDHERDAGTYRGAYRHFDPMMRSWASTPLAPTDLPRIRCKIESYQSENLSLVGFCFHHLVFDGYSKHVFAHDLARSYTALASQDAHELERMNNEAPLLLAKHLNETAYPTRMAQPGMQFPNPVIRNGQATYVRFRWGSRETRALEDLSRQVQGSEFDVLMAILGVCLRNYANRTSEVHFAINTRPADCAHALGMFVSEAFVSVDVSVRDTFLDVVQIVRRSRFRRDEEWLERDVSQIKNRSVDLSSHLARCQFSYLRVPSFHNEFAGRTSKWEFNIPTFGEDEVALYVLRHPEFIDGRLEYNQRIMGYREAKQFVALSRRFIHAFREDHGRVGRWMIKFGQTLPIESQRRVSAPHPTVIDLIDTAVSEYPTGNLGEGKSNITYEELGQQSDMLASQLREELDPGAVVGVCMPDSPLAAVVMMAIWRAGAVYFPLDSSWPTNRINDFAARARCRLILTTYDLRSSLLVDSNVAKLVATSHQDILAKGSHREVLYVPPEAPAYIMFTSGSTGIPKQVVISHGSAASLAASMRSLLKLDSSDRILKFAPLTYDASIWETLCALISGGTLCYYPDELPRVGRTLAAFLKNRRISVATLTPSTLATMSSSKMPSLRLLISAGESCSVSLLKKWGRNRRFINAYGPTETTVCATAYEWDGRTVSSPVSIGVSLPHAHVTVLDHENWETRSGVIGEICVGGEGLASNLGEIINDSKFYRTGDSGWKDNRGEIFLAGRLDDEIKIHGHRIHPSEVERALESAPGVSRAAVVALGSDTKRYLGAGVVIERTVDLDAIRAHVRDNLPASMRPSVIRSFSSLPQTASGKLDRLQISEILGDPYKESSGVSPRRAVLNAWKMALGLDSVAMETHFFRSGGTSLTAAYVAAELSETLLLEISLTSVFDNPTLQLFLAAVEKLMEVKQSFRSAPERVFTNESELSPASAQQELIYRVEQGLLGTHSRELSTFKLTRAWFVEGDLDILALDRAVRVLASRHEILRANYLWTNNELMWRARSTIVNSCSSLPWEGRGNPLVDVLRHHWSHVNVGGGHFRVTVTKVSSKRHILAMTHHHLAVDDESINILVRELGELYNSGLQDDRAIMLRPEQYSEYAKQQRITIKNSPRLATSELTVLREAAPGTQLPSDFPRPRKFLGRVNRLMVDLDSALIQKLHQVSAVKASTLFQIFAAAASRALMKRIHQCECVFFSTYYSRDHRVRNVVGPFARLVSIRIGPVPDEATCVEWLDLTRRAVLEAFTRPIEEPTALGLPDDFDDLMSVLITMKLPEQDLLLRGVKLEPLTVRRRKQRQALEITLTSTGTSESELVMLYRTDVFSRKTVEGMANEIKATMVQLTQCRSMDDGRTSQQDNVCDHRFTPNPILGEAIRYRGVQVRPNEIESIALSVPGVIEARVEEKESWNRNPLGLVIRPSNGRRDEIERQLMRKLQRELPPYAVPEHLSFSGP